MKMKYLLILSLAVFAFACQNGNGDDQKKEGFGEERQFTKAERLKIIRELEEKAFKNDTATLKRSLANDLTRNYFEYKNLYPEDSLSPGFLFKGGEVAMAVGKYEKAIEAFDFVYNSYRDFDKRVESLNLVAFIYDYQLNDKDKARAAYEQLMANHPEHPFAKDAAARLTTLEMTDEELIEHFEKLNAQSSDTL